MNQLPNSMNLLVSAKLHAHHIGLVFLTEARGQRNKSAGRAIAFCRTLFRRSRKLHLHLLSRMGKGIQHDIPVCRDMASVDFCDAVSCLKSCLLGRAFLHDTGQYRRVVADLRHNEHGKQKCQDKVEYRSCRNDRNAG